MLVYQRICVLKTLIKHSINNISFKCNSIRNLNSKTEPILKYKLISFTPKRNFFQFFKRATKEQLKIKDNVPDQYILIYRSTMDRYIFYTQIITSATALLVIGGIIIKNDFVNTQVDFSNWRTPPRQTDNEIYVYLTAFVTIVAILQVMISRLPIRIYNLPQQKKYIFVFYGNYPFTHRKLVCTIGDVIPLPESGVLPWRDGRYLIKNQQQLILVDKYFRRPADLYIMLGVQKDPDVD